jgi:ubiquitin-protein ligase
MSNKKCSNSKNNIKLTTRLLRDVKSIMKQPLTSHGIYYVHDETDMYKGYAMIIGPSDTPYEDGFFFFKFNFPKDYPFQPPKLKYCTNDGITRFNPNLYRNGKVCVSVLNTWKGEQWTSCQTIRSILMTLVTLFISNPLLNEPGFKETNAQCKPYRDCIEYMNYKTAIHGMITQRCIPQSFLGFYPIIKKHIEKKRAEICKRLDKNVKSNLNGKSLVVNVYNMKIVLAYEDLRDKMNIALANI